MEKSLQMINVVKHLIHCLFNLTGISHFSYFLFEMKTSWRTSKYKPIPCWIYYVVMNINFWIYEMLVSWSVFFLLKKYIVQKNIEQIINERNKGKHLIMKNILWLCDIYPFLYLKFLGSFSHDKYKWKWKIKSAWKWQMRVE